jgi:hypothetical protein
MAEPIVGLVAFIAGSYCVYKGLSLLVPESTTMKVPENFNFFSDDKSIHTAGLVTENPIQEVIEQPVTKTVGWASVGNALVETNPMQEIPRPMGKRKAILAAGN